MDPFVDLGRIGRVISDGRLHLGRRQPEPLGRMGDLLVSRSLRALQEGDQLPHVGARGQPGPPTRWPVDKADERMASLTPTLVNQSLGKRSWQFTRTRRLPVQPLPNLDR